MSSLSGSIYSSKEEQPSHPKRSRPPILNNKKASCCCSSKMVKLSSVIILAVVLTVVVTIAVIADPQDETSSRPRSRPKLSSVRKKKPVGALKAPTTLSPVVDEPNLVAEEVTTTTEAILSTTMLPDLASSSPATQVTKARKLPRTPSSPPSPRPPGVSLPADCGECDHDECPASGNSNCANGVVLDRCSCCNICGAGEGHRCFNSTLRLPYNPDIGVCGSGMACLLRSDLEPTEPREALCECRDKRVVCGSDQVTYLSECRLREAAYAKPGLVVSAWMPCVAAPSITTPVENMTVPLGEDVSMSCEVRAYPAPVLHWEFQAEESNGPPLILPGDDSGIVVVVRGGPEQMMTTSWIQIISVTARRQGTYFCVGKNAQGTVQTAAAVTVYKGSDFDNDGI